MTKMNTYPVQHYTALRFRYKRRNGDVMEYLVAPNRLSMGVFAHQGLPTYAIEGVDLHTGEAVSFCLDNIIDGMETCLAVVFEDLGRRRVEMR